LLGFGKPGLPGGNLGMTDEEVKIAELPTLAIMIKSKRLLATVEVQ
jgi:hypothetical protein